MSVGRRRIGRRAFLGGASVAVGLPLLESLPGARAQTAGKPPVRLLYYFVPNGIHMAGWTPATEGAAYTLPPILTSLAPHKNDVLVLSGLANLPARPDGPGDHATGTAAFLTSAHPAKTEGANLQNGISADQIAAQAIGGTTRFRSLQLGIDGGSNAGTCDFGYTCAYARNISWAGPASPLPKQVNPTVVFNQMFDGLDAGASAQDRLRRALYRKSVLDHVREDARLLAARLGTADRRKLDEYLGGVRELEGRIAATEAPGAPTCGTPAAPPTTLSYEKHVEIMSDLMVLAFRCDLTRVITFMLGNGGSNRTYEFIGVSGAHHEISHHQNRAENLAALQTINTWEVKKLAYLLAALRAAPEGAGTLLDNTALFFSSDVEDGNAHRHTNLPVLLAGGAGGALRPGRHVRFTGDAPIANLQLALLRAAGVAATRFGDSTGPLANLA